MLSSYPSDLQIFVQQKISSGEFKSADDFAVRAAQVYRDLDRRYQEIKDSVAESIAEIEAGKYIELSGDEELRAFFDDIKRQGRQRIGAQADRA